MGADQGGAELARREGDQGAPVSGPRAPRHSEPAAPSAARARVLRRGPAAQGGFSLIEVLIALALVGTMIVALATGFMVLVRTTASTNERQRIQAALSNVSESLLTAEYLECPASATAADYQAMYESWDSRWESGDDAPGMDVEIVDVEYWDDDADAFSPSCAEDLGVQRLTVQVEWRDRSDTAQVVKAQP